jgi:hypothetical protein
MSLMGEQSQRLSVDVEAMSQNKHHKIGKFLLLVQMAISTREWVDPMSITRPKRCPIHRTTNDDRRFGTKRRDTSQGSPKLQVAVEVRDKP